MYLPVHLLLFLCLISYIGESVFCHGHKALMRKNVVITGFMSVTTDSLVSGDFSGKISPETGWYIKTCSSIRGILSIITCICVFILVDYPIIIQYSLAYFLLTTPLAYCLLTTPLAYTLLTTPLAYALLTTPLAYFLCINSTASLLLNNNKASSIFYILLLI
jgi:hypothetical protein